MKRGEKYTANIIYVLDYTSVAPVHGAFEEAEALASLYGIHLNSNRPLWQVKLVLYRYSCATEICQSPLLRKEVKLMDADALPVLVTKDFLHELLIGSYAIS